MDMEVRAGRRKMLRVPSAAMTYTMIYMRPGTAVSISSRSMAVDADVCQGEP